MFGIKQVGSWSDRGPYGKYTQNQPAPQEDIRIDSRLSAVNRMYQQPPGRTPILKLSSNSNAPIAWITDPTMGFRFFA